jgi:hypothetical protein
MNAIIWDAQTLLMRPPSCSDFTTRGVEKIGDKQYKFGVNYVREDIQVGDYFTVGGNPVGDCCSFSGLRLRGSGLVGV